MEITKKNESYSIKDTTDKCTINGTIGIEVDNGNTLQLTMSDLTDSSKTVSYNRSISKDGYINVSYYGNSEDIETDIVQYVKDNLSTILETVTK